MSDWTTQEVRYICGKRFEKLVYQIIRKTNYFINYVYVIVLNIRVLCKTVLKALSGNRWRLLIEKNFIVHYVEIKHIKKVNARRHIYLTLLSI